MSEDRRLAVLRAIVTDYVSTREPVGSKALVERHQLAVSPATIRNDMAALEEEGYIVQPHTSAGRIPTDKGYRLFVDRLNGIKPLSAAERRAIGTLLDGATDLDDVLDRTVRLLAQLTQQVAVVQYPSLTRSTVRHIELVLLVPGRLMLVLITEAGRVEQRVLETRVEVSEALLAELRTRLNSAAVGRPLSEVATAVASLPEAHAVQDQPVVRLILDALLDSLAVQREEKLVLAGTANLARAGTDFSHHIFPILETLEEHVVLLRLLDDMFIESGGDVGVRIGSEHAHQGLSETALITSGYGSGGDVLAHLGVLGPTRMDYPTTIAAVRAVARYVSRALAQ